MDDPVTRLRSWFSHEHLEYCLRELHYLHEGMGALIEGRRRRVLEHDDYGYSSWHGYERSPALEAIASDGWIERHLGDFVLLAESPGLGDCCRATARELFGVRAFHVAIQFFPVSDGLVQRLCHDPLDKLEHVKRTAGQLTFCREASCGSYRPPGWGDALISTGSPVFEAREVWR